MRLLVLVFFAVSFINCNSSSKKDPNQAMDDTARMDHPPVRPLPAEIKPVKIPVDAIPSAIQIKGTVQEAWQWTDSLGDNIFVTSGIAPHAIKDEYGDEAQSASLHAYHFTKKMSSDYRQLWVLNEVEKACSLDLTCGFSPGSATITDLDKDGIAETTIQYSLACRGDVSPATHKLVMYEDGTKYSLLGYTWIAYGPDLKFAVTEKDVNLDGAPKLKDENDEMLRTFGRYENEKEFAAAPAVFLSHARSQWIQHVREKMGE
jgi:hypothetical protein